MSRRPSLESLLKKAENKEKKHDWLEADKLYEQVANAFEKTNFLGKGEIQEKKGCCLHRAAFQASSPEEFRQRIRQAIEAYDQACTFYDKLPNPQKTARLSRCKVVAKYLSHWLASNSSEKRQMLDQCCLFGEKSLKAHKDAGDDLSYGKMCNDLLFYVLERLFIATDGKEIRNITQKGLDYADKAIAVLSKLGNKSELLRAYSTASLQSFQAYIYNPQKGELRQRSLSLLENALELSREVNIPRYVAISHWAACSCNLLFLGKIGSSLKHAKEMLKQGMIVRDNYLKGVASYLLAFVINWMTEREEDPDKRKEGHEKIIGHAENAIRNLCLISQDFFIAETYLFYAESYSSQSDFEVSLEGKRTILEKAVETGRKGLEYAVRSGSLDAKGSTLHALSKALHFSSNLETESKEKKKLLEDALVHRKEYVNIVKKAFPSNNWVYGVGRSYEALIKTDLAKLETDEYKKRVILESAISDIENGVSQCGKWISSHPVPTYIATIARFEDMFGGILNDLFFLTKNEKMLRRAIEVYEDASKRFSEISLSSRVAETYWKMARNEARLNQHKNAANDFKNASIEYNAAARRIPNLSDFYQNYTSYMRAWSEIERAKSAHKKEEWISATRHYRRAANLLKRSKMWEYLTPNFLAWSLLEQAENLSRRESCFRSIEAFKKATELFLESRSALRVKLDTIESVDERDVIEKLIAASDSRRQYCFARIAFEEAKILDRKGKHVASSGKYGVAAEKFQDAIDAIKHDTNSQELRPLVDISLAWQMMKQAEAEASPDLYLEASKLFEEVKEHSLDEKARVLALGHSSFCRALEAGTRFEASRDTRLYLTAVRRLESASNYYVKAGFKTASEYAKATHRLFDAYIYVDRAATETDPIKKAQHYQMAEKLLQVSVRLFKKAKHPEKSEEVARQLESIREEQQLASSLSEILYAPEASSTTASFYTPIPTYEKAVGLEIFEHAHIQTSLIVQNREVNVGEDVVFEIEMVNTGKGPATLVKIEDFLPTAKFNIVHKPEMYRVEDSYLNLKGRRLDALKTENIKIVAKPQSKGTFKVKPRILYTDALGKHSSHEPEPITITVKELGIKGWIRGER